MATLSGKTLVHIDEVPPGRYRLTAWHEGWVITGKDKDGRPVYDPPRVLAQEVTVPPRGEVAVEFELSSDGPSIGIQVDVTARGPTGV